MFAEELADLKDRYGPRFDLVHVLSREPRDVELFSGRLDADRLRRMLTALVPVSSLDHVWLCGPFPMISDAREVLAELGVPRERVHFELFYVDEPPPELHRPDAVVTGETSNVTVVLDGRTTTAAMPKDQPILDSAQHTRADLPFACKGGVCGTCRAHLSSGEVRHAPQLRARGGRGGARVRAHLPELPGLRRAHGGLRCLSRWVVPRRRPPRTVRTTSRVVAPRRCGRATPPAGCSAWRWSPSAPGTATVSMRVRPDMINGWDLCHGGLVAALADSAFAVACNSHGTVTVAAGFDVAFLEGARLDDELVAEATERAVRGRSGVYDVTVRRAADDVVVAEFRGRSRSTGTPNPASEGQ